MCWRFLREKNNSGALLPRRAPTIAFAICSTFKTVFFFFFFASFFCQICYISSLSTASRRFLSITPRTPQKKSKNCGLAKNFQVEKAMWHRDRMRYCRFLPAQCWKVSKNAFKISRKPIPHCGMDVFAGGRAFLAAHQRSPRPQMEFVKNKNKCFLKS